MRLDRRIAVLDQPTEFYRSDVEHTIFVGSSWQIADLREGRPAVEAEPDERLWEHANGKWPQLEGCIWLADRERITNDEAIKGGTYRFERKFELPCKVSAISSAFLDLIVDDVCELALNTHAYPQVRGYLDKVHRFDLSKNLIDETNTLDFIIHNDSFEAQNRPDVNYDFFSSQTKWKKNPYGFKYLLTIKYRR